MRTPPPKTSLTPLADPLIAGLPAYTTSELHTRTGAVLHAITEQQAAVLTRHRWALFVLMTAERYRRLNDRPSAGLDAVEALALVRQIADCAARAAQAPDTATAQTAQAHGQRLYALLAQQLGTPAAEAPPLF